MVQATGRTGDGEDAFSHRLRPAEEPHGVDSRFPQSNRSYGPPRRYRRAPQRRQVHAFQRAERGGRRGGELSVLHHRAERRRGRRP